MRLNQGILPRVCSFSGGRRIDEGSDETVQAVHTWLNDSGIHTDRHQLSEGLGWLQFDVSSGLLSFAATIAHLHFY
jgi:hypothetical protein